MRVLSNIGLIVLSTVFCASNALAIVNFEVQGPLMDNAPIDGITFTDSGVSFVFGVDLDFTDGPITREAGNHVFLEATGQVDPSNGFAYDQGGVYDTEHPDAGLASPFGLDSYFLRTEPVGAGGNSLDGDGVLVIEYTVGSPTEASGQIWDIDGGGAGTEQFRVRAWAADGLTILETLLSPVGVSNGAGSLDGLPWEFSIAAMEPIQFITINFIGSKTNNIGLAFDNFNAVGSVIPEPGAYTLLAGLLTAGFVATKRRKI